MFIGLKIAVLIVGIWAGFKLGKIGIEWLKEAFEHLRPQYYRKDRF